MKFSTSDWIFTGAVAAILAAAAFLLPPCPIWITDNGNKYIIMRNFAEHNTVKLHHIVPELAQTGTFHIQHHEGALRSFYPEFYPVLCSYFYSKSCERTAAIPAMAGTIICAMLVLYWSKSKLLAGCTAVGTALFFYSFVLWEMTLSCAAVSAAILLTLKLRRPLLGGLLLGASLLLREEAYFAAAAFAFALLIFREYRSMLLFCAGAAIGMLPNWVYQYIQFGSILGLHGKIYLAGTGEFSFAGTLWNYFHHLLRNEPTSAPGEIYITIVPTIFLLASGFIRNKAVKCGALLLMLTGAVVMLARYLQQSGFSYPAACSTGFFAAVPVGWLFFADLKRSLCRQAKIYRIASCFILVYILTVPSVLTRGDVGLIWSARHFILLMPLLVILSAKSWNHIKSDSLKFSGYLPLGIIVFAICQQLAGIYSLNAISRESSNLENTIRQYKTPIIASDVFYLPEMTPRLWFENVMLDISTSEKADSIKELRPQEMLLILSAKPQFRRITNTDLAELMKNYTPQTGVQHFRMSKGTGFIDLLILKLKANGVKK